MDNDKIIVSVSVPVVGCTYDAVIPRRLRLAEVTRLLADMLEEIQEGSFVASEDVAICDRNTGAILNINITVDELGLKNGSQLMII